MIACFLSNIFAKYYKNPSMFSRVIAKNVGHVFETQCRLYVWEKSKSKLHGWDSYRYKFCCRCSA